MATNETTQAPASASALNKPQRRQLTRVFDAVTAMVRGSRFPDSTVVGEHTHEVDERSVGALIEAGFAHRHRSWDNGVCLTPAGVAEAMRLAVSS